MNDPTPQEQERARAIACDVFGCENFHEDGCQGLTLAIAKRAEPTKADQERAWKVGSPEHVEFWDAIHDWAGKMYDKPLRSGRGGAALAVIRVERAVEIALAKQRDRDAQEAENHVCENPSKCMCDVVIAAAIREQAAEKGEG